MKLIKFGPYCRVIMNNSTRLVKNIYDYVTICFSFICWSLTDLLLTFSWR